MDLEIIPDGYTRVSSILSIFQNYAKVDRTRLKRAQDTGTAIHEAIKSFYQDEFQPLHFREVPYMQSFLKWQECFKPKPILFEERLFDHHLKITGRIDLLATIDGHPVLVDFKTGSLAHPSIWELQGTFYRHLLNYQSLLKQPLFSEMTIPTPDTYLFVQLQKEGTDPLLHEFHFKLSSWEACLSAIKCYHFFEGTQSPI